MRSRAEHHLGGACVEVHPVMGVLHHFGVRIRAHQRNDPLPDGFAAMHLSKDVFDVDAVISKRLLTVIFFRRGSCSFSNRVSYSDRRPAAMPVVSRDVIWLLSQIRVISFRTSQTCTCGGYTSCSCRRAHACSSGTVFVTVTVDRGRCADQLDRRRGYARPAVGSRPRSRENMVAVNADALVRLTRAVLPAISPSPLRYRLPLWSPTTATAIADRPARANSS